MFYIWIYDGILYVYALSLLFYFSDFIHPNQRAKHIGTGLLIFVWILQSVFFVTRMMEQQAFPLFSMFETLLFFSWLMVSTSLILNLLMRMDLVLLFINAIGFAALALNLFSDQQAAPTLSGWNVQDELLFVHISLAFMSYAAFVVSAIFALFYLFLHWRLKSKKWSKFLHRLPSLDRLERFSFRLVMIGLPLLFLSLLLGIVWILLTDSFSLWLDAKVINSLFILLAYGFYMYKRIHHLSGPKLVIYNLAAFLFVFINYFISNYVSVFHQWIWS